MRRLIILVPVIVALLSSTLLLRLPRAEAQMSLYAQAAAGRIGPVILDTGKVQRRISPFSGGIMAAARELAGGAPGDAALAGGALPADAPVTLPTTRNGDVCGRRNQRTDAGVRVNQDCGYNSQAEEIIAANPVDPTNLIAGQNDNRIGVGHCGFDYSFDSGATWHDGILPFFNRIPNPTPPHTVGGGPRSTHLFDFAADPAVAFDSQGRAYFSCILSDFLDSASGLYVTRSDTGGTFYNTLYGNGLFGPRHVVDEENNGTYLPDKEFITADSYPSSPFRDNVYVAWHMIVIAPRCVSPTNPVGYCAFPTYFSRSTDHGNTWSAPQEIGGINPKLCFFGNIFDPTANPNACNITFGGDPVVLPNGNIVMVAINGNTPAGDPNSQHLAFVSRDGGLTFSPAVKVADIVDSTGPMCQTRTETTACVPGQNVRTNSLPRLAVNRDDGTLYAAWQDYRTGKWGIQLSRSTDGGLTWQGSTGPIVADATDDSQAAIAIRSETGTVVLSYYRTAQVPNENSGNVLVPGQPGVGTTSSDYAVAYGHGLVGPYTALAVAPPFPAPDGIQAGFLGDYSGLTVVGSHAHPIWSDTRNAAPPGQLVAHDEDIYTSDIRIP